MFSPSPTHLPVNFQKFSTTVDKAFVFAENAHRGQERKWTNEPYIVHPIQVADILYTVTDDENIIIAGLLHDTIEDTAVTFEDIVSEFGEKVASTVLQVSKVSKPEDGNRAIRKEIDRLHYAKGDYGAQTVKLADIISNSHDVVSRAPGFAEIYLKEQIDLTNSLTVGNKYLSIRAIAALDRAIAALERSKL